MSVPSDIQSFQGPEFELFLRQRLCSRAEHSPIIRNELCNFEAHGVPFGDSYLDSLVNLYNEMLESAQVQFHLGLVGLFRHAEVDQFSGQGMSDLIYLIGMTRCYPGLDALAPVLGTGAWGEMYPRLIYDALSVIQMFPSSDKSYEAARDLATSVNFKDRYVFDAYAVLIAGRPRAWLADLQLLARRFDRLAEQIQQQGTASAQRKLVERRKRLAHQMGKLIPLTGLADSLDGLNPGLPMGGQLLRSLLGDNGPLACEKSDDTGYEIVDRKDVARRAPVAIGPKILLAMMKWRLIGQRNPGLRSSIGRGLIYAAEVQKKLARIEQRREPGLETASEAL